MGNSNGNGHATGASRPNRVLRDRAMGWDRPADSDEKHQMSIEEGIGDHILDPRGWFRVMHVATTAPPAQ